MGRVVDVWRGRAREVLGPNPVSWVETSPAATTSLLRAGHLADEMLADAAKVAVPTWRRRATFGRSNVFVAVPRQFHGVRFATADGRMIFASGRSRGLVSEGGKPARESLSMAANVNTG